ncbi:uncharacterized protein LOC131893397 [Tigriopus californicus]|uniref:uncharacterized protein LOC131893397 n=1 Tax=Tigriopus californicus TaxID=6832 RepID=UPI0027DA053A|nr:uncharacterized protein LOC131893397 [Tigriopus californicus]
MQSSTGMKFPKSLIKVLMLALIGVNRRWTLALIVRGTTLGPDFVRIMGAVAKPCPIQFPAAFDSGSKCCKSFSVADRVTALEFEDSESTCTNNDWIACPTRHMPCISHFKPYICPIYASVGLDQGCCTASVTRWAEKETPPCRGVKISMDTPSSCCPTEAFIYVEACAQNRRKCLNYGPLPHVVKPIQPIVLEEESWEGYNASFALIDSLCDIKHLTYWISKPRVGHFVFDLGYHLIPHKLTLRNSRHDEKNRRAVQDFTFSGSGIEAPYDWVQLATGRLENPMSPEVPFCGVPLTFFPIKTDFNLRYFRFDIDTYYNHGGALNYITVE